MEIIQNGYAKWGVRLVNLGITYLCADCIVWSGEPSPLYIKVQEGIICALILTAGLWACTTKFSLKYPYLVAVYMIPTGIIATLAMFLFNRFLIVFVATFYLFQISRLIIFRKRSII